MSFLNATRPTGLNTQDDIFVESWEKTKSRFGRNSWSKLQLSFFKQNLRLFFSEPFRSDQEFGKGAVSIHNPLYSSFHSCFHLL